MFQGSRPGSSEDVCRMASPQFRSQKSLFRGLHFATKNIDVRCQLLKQIPMKYFNTIKDKKIKYTLRDCFQIQLRQFLSLSLSIREQSLENRTQITTS